MLNPGSARALDLTPTAPRITVVVCGIALAFNEGGLRSYVSQLTSGLSRVRKHWEIRLLVPEGAHLPRFPAGVIVERVPRELKWSRALVSQIATALRLGRIARDKYPDAVFITPTDFWSIVAPSCRIAVTHDVIPDLDPVSRGSWLRRINRRLDLNSARKSARWLSVSQTAANEVARIWGKRRRPQPMCNWVDQRFEEPVSAAAVRELRKRLGLPKRFFLYLGGYRKYKNVELLIRAHAAAVRHASVPPLVLGGRIPHDATLTSSCDVHGEIRRSGAEPGSVLMPGFIGEADLPALYSAATLFVSASLHEGFGYPPVEAMATGCPVLVADRSAFREMVPRVLSRFDPDDEPGLCRKLIEAASSPRNFACPFPSHFSEREGAERFARCIEDLVADGVGVPIRRTPPRAEPAFAST